MADETQNNVEEVKSPSPAVYNPVSSVVRRQVRPQVTRGMPMTRATHKNWKRTMKLLKSLGKTV
jgi:hypothetical protein